MKIKLFKKIKHFVPKALETIAIAFIIILSLDILCLIFDGWHLNEVMCKTTCDLHDKGFAFFITLIIVPFIVDWFIKYKYKKQAIMDKTDLHSSLLFLMLKLEEAKSNPMQDKNFVEALTEVLRYFRDNGELKKAYELQKDSLADMANSPWAKLVIVMLTSKMQEDKVDAELPDIDAIIKESSSDEFIEKKIKDILGD
jgi:hypothetical protein